MYIKNEILSYIITLITLPNLINSICPGQFWNPLNNACVDCTISNHIECPWDNTTVYFADSVNNRCVLTCPTIPSLYANDLTQ